MSKKRATNGSTHARESPAPPEAASARPDFSLVIPTYNEAQGLRALLEAIQAALGPAQIVYEVVLVDDNSPDGTAALAEQLAREFPVRVLRRSGKLGLSSAVIDGWKIAHGRVLGVMDADLSHDPRLLPSLYRSVDVGTAEVAVGSRYVAGGGMGNWPLWRQFISQVAVWMGSIISPVRDVTSGYLVLRHSVIEGVNLNPIGFKIGLELLVRGRYRTFTEIPYVFQDRAAGQSKLTLRVIREYLVQLGQLVAFWIATRPQRQRVESLSAETTHQTIKGAPV